jgi:hypothetical protein
MPKEKISKAEHEMIKSLFFKEEHSIRAIT